MHRYNRLHPRAGYLGNISLTLSRANGLTHLDLEAAEAGAAGTIDSRLAGLYSTRAWGAVPPGIIERTAGMLSAAHALRTRRRGLADVEPRLLPDVLEAEAHLLLEGLARGQRPLYDAAGERQVRTEVGGAHDGLALAGGAGSV